MSDDAGGAPPSGPKSKPNLQTILVLANTVLVLVAVGATVYTKLLYERPAIVEEVELQKKVEEIKEPEAPPERGVVKFDNMMINLLPTKGVTYYVSMTFAVETRDAEATSIVKAKKALFVDKVINLLGKRQATDLNTIQGKLMLKTELIREFNTIAPPGGIVDFYFTDFTVSK